MTQVMSPLVELAGGIVGTVVTPEDPGYDDARRVWNADTDRRPVGVVYCETASDVAAAVRCARATSLEISVRAGAHSTSGMSVGDAGLVIDVSRMSTVTVDPEARRAVVGGGALLRDLDAATHEHGLAVPAGEISHTGVAGLTLGGGMGWLTRQHGLAVDNLLGAEVVLADGRVVRASDDENPDLFWAIRGGGGNFGVVTSFEFSLHEVGPLVGVGLLFYGSDRAADALRQAQRTVENLPPDVSFQVIALTAPPLPFVPPEHVGSVVFCLVAVGFGTEESHARVLDGVRSGVAPLFEMVAPMPYPVLQQLFDGPNGWGSHAYDTTVHLGALTDDVAELLVERALQMTAPFSVVHCYALGGAYSTADEDATAFGGGRSPRWTTFIIALSPDAAGLVVDRAWARGLRDALLPHALDAGAYVNGLGREEGGRVEASYGAKYARLSRIKAEYDPENLFHRNANILPAG